MKKETMVLGLKELGVYLHLIRMSAGEKSCKQKGPRREQLPQPRGQRGRTTEFTEGRVRPVPSWTEVAS